MTASDRPRLALPDAPALVPYPGGAIWLTADGEIDLVDNREAARRALLTPPMVCHRRATSLRLGLEALPAFDILELFAFVRPARFCVPTARGLADALHLAPPPTHTAEAACLFDAAAALLNELIAGYGHGRDRGAADAKAIAWAMARGGWAWGAAVLAALGAAHASPTGLAAFKVWDRLPEWSDHAPQPSPGGIPVDPAEARSRLAAMLGDNAEPRPTQADFASAASLAFQPRQRVDEPNLVLAEAGTGTGKTLGYIAPASLWAEKNGAPVWISTYTRNLQRQLDGELSRLHPDPAHKFRRVVIRKGRENYLCLLNFEEAVRRLPAGGDAVALGLLARWALSTRDGDLAGGDLPGWLTELFGRGAVLGLADRRGECVYSACAHFRKCFIERTIRRARRADIVVANHALVMAQAALGGLDDSTLPNRYVFDEGHHLFDAADSAFSATLSGLEAAELRRWLLGDENEGRASRARGLKRRASDLVEGRPEAAEALDQALAAARLLPAPGWHQRLNAAGHHGPFEQFLGLVRSQVRARADDVRGPYSLECDPTPLVDGLAEVAAVLATRLLALETPLKRLAGDLTGRLDDEAAELDSATRQRIEAIVRGIGRRALVPLAAWRGMLDSLTGEIPAEFVDWFAIERLDGRDIDVGYHRHWVDPMLPFAKAVVTPAHGVLITSATLRDSCGDPEADWRAAEKRTGAAHLGELAIRAAMPSPFDYPARTRVLVVNDVRKDDLDQVAAAYRELFLAAGGGGLGLFTAISRLKAVGGRIAAPLDAAGIRLLAQHGDGMDTGTLVDIFRAEEDSCLLGTDAVRDGVDVPGRALRLIVFDRVPWPRPDILHRVRRAAGGGKTYDDMITRLRLKQAFGRLVRSAGDFGVFVLLDPMMPSRLAGAFPEGVAPKRVGLAEAIGEVREFLSAGGDPQLPAG
jgi:ATP-dependent DNA helicase DinG